MTIETIFTEALALPADQRAKLATQLRQSLPINQLPTQPTMIPGPEGSLGDHPLFDEWLAAVAAYRKQREAEEEALEAAGE